MKSENGVGGNVKMTLTMLAAPAFARFEEVGFVTNAAMRTTHITNITSISPTVSF